jgi:hypothetical protein
MHPLSGTTFFKEVVPVSFFPLVPRPLPGEDRHSKKDRSQECDVRLFSFGGLDALGKHGSSSLEPCFKKL